MACLNNLNNRTFASLLTFACLPTLASLLLFCLPAIAVPKHQAGQKHQAAHHTARTLDEATRRHIYLLRTQTIYLAVARFPRVSADKKPQEAYQLHLLAAIDRRCGITEAQASAIDAEGAKKMWPQMGLDGHILRVQ